MKTELREPALSHAVIAEAVRLIEEVGPLDDAAALREALAPPSPDDATRVSRRALALGQRIGLQAELVRARHWAPWIAAGLVVLIVMAGLGLTGSVVGGSERRINIMTALVSLLGVHVLTLSLWLLGLAGPWRSFNGSLGWVWLALTARVAGGRHGQAPALLRSATELLTRARLLPWAFGLVSHAIWALSFIVVLGALLFALAFRSYTLSWETTILEPGFFVRGVQVLGWLPGWLGFPVPDAATVLMSPGPIGASGSLNVSGSSGQRAWAWWLTGCIVVYGLLPRLFFVALSAWIWRRRHGALQPDLSLPYYRKLLARFEALAPAAIVDADGGAAWQRTPDGLSAAQASDALMLVGFELPPEAPWPPETLHLDAVRALRIDGSGLQRRQLLDMAAQVRPRVLVMMCRAASSPDRSIERLLRELLGHCGECRLWLVGETPDGRQCWRRWLHDVGLERIAADDDVPAVLRAAT